MDWLDRNLQREILKELNNIYPDSKTYEYWIDAAIAQVVGVIETVGEAELYIAKRSANLRYLAEHGLVVCNDKYLSATVKITAKGIDFLTDDGGLSAILGVVTVKLHSDTIQALIAAKIDQAEISDSEKSWLKKELGKIKDTALSTLTTNAINAIAADTLVKFLKSAIGL
ncbi:MAG: hypothetical protein HXM87_03045 [Neisseria sp.]|uniref:hypothetical protein n=1 Tax=Neisseria sp. TaxID=192066 RepID=UPI001CB663F2|nr:hypothetical protein [Neisseria sp.]MBF1277399.1 hypothetical protein [Neisseria sp.]MBF1281100.1 hypothetical protein [Neisseria sp.]